MISKEHAGKLQLLVNEYTNNLKSIRNKSFDRSSVYKKVLEEEIIDKKIKILENGFNKIGINEQIVHPGSLIELLDLKNLNDEIADEKLFKRENFKNKKAQSEKSLLYQFEKEFTEGSWKEIFENEKKIVIVLDNAPIHIAKKAKTIAKILNIELIFLEKYSSDLNPIERVWYALKDIASITYIEDEMFLMTLFARLFYIYANSPTLTKKWLDTYIT